MLRFPEGKEISVLAEASTMGLGPIQPPIQLVPGALPLGVKRIGHEADRPSPPSSKEWVELYFHSSLYLLAVCRYSFSFTIML